MPDILDLLIKEDGCVHPTRVIAGHMDLTTHDRRYMKRVAEYGTFFELDGFGHPCPTEGVYVSDGDRVGAVEWMISEGHEDQLLFSHDIGLKSRLSGFGGPGYDHIMNVIIPALSRDGVARDVINKILIEQPTAGVDSRRRVTCLTAEQIIRMGPGMAVSTAVPAETGKRCRKTSRCWFNTTRGNLKVCKVVSGHHNWTRQCNRSAAAIPSVCTHVFMQIGWRSAREAERHPSSRSDRLRCRSGP